MDIPNHLSHKPVVKLENYADIDGMHAGKTDAVGLSIGLSQWGDEELSAKVWRHTDTRWSRQSEELPIHRVIDLTSMVCAAIYYADHAKLPEHSNLDISLANNKEYIAQLKKLIQENRPHLETSINNLKQILQQL
ncbi:hypothetical protein A9Z61_09330 [Moraxella osloensis]|nr:DUF6530 family protein [Moraxella osloensis]OBX55281.1 hypothetical protein A9Z61_09330 [Moraxella osloensis]